MATDLLGLWHQVCCPRRRRGSCLTLILSHFIVTALFFHLGSLHASIFRCHFHYNPCLYDGGSTSHAKQKKPYSHNVSRRGLDEDPHHQGHHHHRHQGHQNLLYHAVRIPRMEFAAHLNLGIPVEPSSAGNQNVLLLRLPPYPQNNNTAESSSSNNNNKQPVIIPLQSVDEALSFCHIVKLVLTRPSRGGGSVQRGATTTAGTNSEAALSGETCLAIAVGPHDSFHMNKWIRPADNNNNQNNNKHNLQPVGRLVWNPSPKNKNNASSSVDGSVATGELFQQPPSIDKTTESFQLLESYLKIRNQVVNELQAILSQMTASSTTTSRGGGGGGKFKNKAASPVPTIIVMVANQGHADLFFNYCCAARAVGMDFLRNNNKNHHHLLLFAMDEATHKMAQQQQDQDLGITSFYNPDLFSAIPMDAKGTTTYRSASNGHVMLAKIYAVELIVSLGYNVLFQDVDIVPYRADYVSYLQEKILQEETNNVDNAAASSFDLYFQYGHVPGSIFAPYSANSGFFYVQSNVRTRYFFSKLVASGMDLILDTNSHQATMAQLLLSEQTSLFGLRVKILQGKPYRQQLQQRQQHQPNDDDNDVDDEAWLFPNGYYFHTKPEYMVRLFKKKIHPFLFHMNWSNNKTIKVKFLQQMGDWYIKDDCLVVSEQQQRHGDVVKNNGFSGDCCVLKPVPKCHYRDMPSPNPCRESPAFQRPDAKSFW